MRPQRAVRALLRGIAAVLVLSALPAFAQESGSDEGTGVATGKTYEQLISEANAAVAARKFDRARELFRAALARRPGSLDAREGQARAEDDDYWYGRSPGDGKLPRPRIDFTIPTSADWQRHGLSRTRNLVLEGTDLRGLYGDSGLMGRGDVGPRLIDSGGRYEQGSADLASRLDARNVAGPRGNRTAGGSGPVFRRPETITTRQSAPGGGDPVGPRDSGYRGTTGGNRRITRSGGGFRDPVRGRSSSSMGIAAVTLGVLLPYIYEYAVPLDLTLEPLGSSRASGFSAMFGFAPMRGAAVLDKGLWKVGMSYSNWFGTMDKEGVFLDPAPAASCSTSPLPAGCPGKRADVPANGTFYRFRFNRFDEGVLTTEVGVGYGVELGLGLTLASLKEGHGGPDRSKIQLNRDGYAHVAERSRVANVGNLLVSARWGMPWGGADARDTLSGVGFALDAKVPLGDPADFVTSGTFDLALTAILTQVLLDRDNPVYVHLNVGFMMPIAGEDGFFEHPPVASATPAPPLDDEIEARGALYAGLGISWKISRHIVLMVGAEGNASPYDAGDDAPDGLGDGSFGVSDGLSFTAHAGMRVLFDKLFFEGSVGHDVMVGDVRGMTGRISVALFFGGGGAGGGRGGAPGGNRFIPNR